MWDSVNKVDPLKPPHRSGASASGNRAFLSRCAFSHSIFPVRKFHPATKNVFPLKKIPFDFHPRPQGLLRSVSFFRFIRKIIFGCLVFSFHFSNLRNAVKLIKETCIVKKIKS